MGRTVVYDNKTFKIMLFYKMKGSELSNSLHAEFDMNWKSIFKKMMKAQ